MNNKISLIIGLLLIILGLVFIANSLHIWGLESSWPIILLIVGLTFIIAFFSSKNNPGLLLPGAMLILTSVPFFICSISRNWDLMANLWPLFLLGPAAGFFLMYFGGIKEKGLLVPAFILTGLAAIFFLSFSYFSNLWPIIFILGGAVFIYLGIKDKKQSPKATEIPQEPAATEKPE